MLFADDAISSERSLNRIEQILVPEWFGEKLNRARLHGLDRHRNVRMCCEKDDRNTYFPSFQFVLKIQAANAGKSHVKNQATGTITARTRQELLCSSERLRMQADRLQQLLERLTHISIIIDNEYGWHIPSAHNDALNQKGSQNQNVASFILSSPIKRRSTTPDRLYRMTQCRSLARPRRRGWNSRM